MQFTETTGVIDKNQTEKDIPVDFINDEDKYVIYADVCGVSKSDINLSIKGQVLMISAERKFEVKNGFHFSEIKTGPLFKVIELKPDINPNEIIADYHDGLLKITIPKIKNEESIIIKIQ